MNNRFEVSIRSKPLSEAVAPALQEAHDAWEKMFRDGVDTRGAVFCQIKEDGGRLTIIGNFVEGKYAERIQRVLKKYKREKLSE